MYVGAGLHQLSEAQIKKLLKGDSVRVKAGTHHKVHLSSEQSKKLHKAHAKGAGITLCFDPYQCDAHEHLVGSGLGSRVKSIASKALAGAKKAFSAAPPSLRAAIKSKAIEGLQKGVEHFSPQIESRLGKFGIDALSHGQELARQQISQFGEEPQNEIIPEGMGMGLRKRRVVHRPKGGALKMRDLREGVKKIGRAASRVARAAAPVLGGVAGAEFGPMGSLIGSRLASAAVGGGVRRGRPRKHRGGALYPAGSGFEDEC